MAPRLKLTFLSGMTRSASICCSTPRPPQAGHAPNGLLNENSRGSISGIVKPDTGQAKRSEKIKRCGPLWSWILAPDASRTPPSPALPPAPPPDRGGGTRCLGPRRPFPALLPRWLGLPPPPLGGRGGEGGRSIWRRIG